MADRYDLKTARTAPDGKTYWTKIGVMFPFKGDKDGFSIIMEALPVPAINDQGTLEVRVMAMEPYKDDGQSDHNKAKANGFQPQDTLDDEIPF